MIRAGVTEVVAAWAGVRACGLQWRGPDHSSPERAEWSGLSVAAMPDVAGNVRVAPAIWLRHQVGVVDEAGKQSMEETSSTDTSDTEHTSRGDAPATLLPSRSFGEVRGFNGLRGIELLIVFVAHLEVILPIPTFLVIPGATVSLDSFFVLSGFLITALLLREQVAAAKSELGRFPDVGP